MQQLQDQRALALLLSLTSTLIHVELFFFKLFLSS